MLRALTLAIMAVFLQSASGQATSVSVLRGGDLTAWHKKEFAGDTRYTPVRENEMAAIAAYSDGTASGMVREITVDLTQTPFLNWQWRVANVLTGNDERSKQGDDYAARVYVVVSGGLFFWKTRAVNYVWSSHQPVGTVWPNAYTSNAQMLAVRSGTAQLGQWVTEKRNVREDLRKLFGEDIREIHAVAIMTDTDNTSAQASAYYGDIYFSNE